MAGFEFATAGRILFGPGSAAHAPALALAFSRRVLVVTGATPERAAWLVEALEQQGAVCTLVPVSSEPDVAFVQDGAMRARRDRCGAIVSVGGESAIDAGKAIAVLATNEGDPFDYLEVIGRGMPLSVFADSALRHLLKAIAGYDDEPHWDAFVWNALCLAEGRERIRRGIWPAVLDDLPKTYAGIRPGF